MAKSAASRKGQAFATRLKARRIECGFASAADFARHIDVEEATYRKWERGGAEPGIAALAKIHQALSISLDFLIAGEAPAGASPPGFHVQDTGDDQRHAG